MNEVTPVILPKWVRGGLYSKISGYSPDSLKYKRQNGDWLEGVHWVKAPDGNILYNWRAIDDWAEHGHKKTATRS